MRNTCKQCKKEYVGRKKQIYCSKHCKCVDLYTPPTKGKRWKVSEQGKLNMSGRKEDKSPHWKGDKVGYRALHNWIEMKRGKPKYCEHCKLSGLPQRQYHWANVSGDYKRELTDWIRLCVKCHGKYDKSKRSIS